MFRASLAFQGCQWQCCSYVLWSIQAWCHGKSESDSIDTRTWLALTFIFGMLWAINIMQMNKCSGQVIISIATLPDRTLMLNCWLQQTQIVPTSQQPSWLDRSETNKWILSNMNIQNSVVDEMLGWWKMHWKQWHHFIMISSVTKLSIIDFIAECIDDSEFIHNPYTWITQSNSPNKLSTSSGQTLQNLQAVTLSWMSKWWKIT